MIFSQNTQQLTGMENLNLLRKSLITVLGPSGQKIALSLPGLFAAMGRQEVAGFTSLRPHQRPAWHMFLVQLAVLALRQAGELRPPEDSESWAFLLQGLTLDFPYEEPWCLIVENAERPAFLQPPDPGDLRWRTVRTPDGLDVVNTSKNFDQKREVTHASEAEDWLYALVSLQTTGGFGGQRNHGIVRMSSGLSSRPLLGLAPGTTVDMRVCPSAWWTRDVDRLVKNSQRSEVGTVGGPALMWCLPWPEKEQLEVPDLDPCFIEVCRRVRLENTSEGIAARRSTSIAPRTNGACFKGNVGDPWMPVENKQQGKSLTLGRRGFTYVQLYELLFSGKWRRPMLAEHGPQETGEMVLVAEAFARGRHRSEGFHARRVPVPGRRCLESGAAAECARRQIEEIKAFDAILRNALVAVPSGSDWRRIESTHYEYTQMACGRFDRQADRLFFEALWERVAACDGNGEMSVDSARRAFLNELLRVAEIEFDMALSSMPGPSTRRRIATESAHRKFRKGLQEHFPELSEPGESKDKQTF